MSRRKSKTHGGKCRIAHNLKNLTYEDCNLASDYLCYRIKFFISNTFQLERCFYKYRTVNHDFFWNIDHLPSTQFAKR